MGDNETAIPTDFIRTPGLGNAEFRLWIILKSLANEDGQVSVSYSVLGSMMNAGRRHVLRVMENLENRGCVTVERHPGDVNVTVVIEAARHRHIIEYKTVDARREKKRPKISQALRTKVFERDMYRCVHCNTHLKLAVDHILPISRGGTNSPDNLQTLCATCNGSKGARLEIVS